MVNQVHQSVSEWPELQSTSADFLLFSFSPQRPVEVNSDVLGSELVPVPAGRYRHGCGNLRVIRALLRESGEASASTHPAESQEPRLRPGSSTR